MKNPTQMIETQSLAQAAATDAVKAQVQAGKPNRGMPKTRHVATVADVIYEILVADGFIADGADSKDVRQTLRAALSGSLLNASQFRQELEKSGVLVKETALDTEYGVE